MQSCNKDTHTHTMSSNKRRTKDRLRYYVITKYKQVHSDSNDCNRATIQQQQHDAHFLIPITTRSQVTLQATQWGTRPMYVYIYTPILRDRNRMQSTCRERDLHKPISPSENWKQELGTTRMYSFFFLFTFHVVPRRAISIMRLEFWWFRRKKEENEIGITSLQVISKIAPLRRAVVASSSQ